MCTFREGLWRRAVEQGEAQGLSKGIEQGTLNNLKNNLKSLMKNQAGLDLEKLWIFWMFLNNSEIRYV